MCDINITGLGWTAIPQRKRRTLAADAPLELLDWILLLLMLPWGVLTSKGPRLSAVLLSCLHPAAVHFVIVSPLTSWRVFLPIRSFPSDMEQQDVRGGIQGYPDRSSYFKLRLTMKLSPPGLHLSTAVKVSLAVCRPASAGAASSQQGFGTLRISMSASLTRQTDSWLPAPPASDFLKVLGLSRQ